MPRHHRICYLEAVYHITCRGNNKIDIFLDDEDCEKYMQYLLRAKAKYGFKLFAYALMKNHMHLLIEDIGKYNKPVISKIMASVNTSYSMQIIHKVNNFFFTALRLRSGQAEYAEVAEKKYSWGGVTPPPQ